MEKLVTNKALISRILTGVSVLSLVFALNVSGALAGFWRTIDGITANGISNPTQFLYGFGTSDTLGFGVYGYGYGYGYGSFAAGYGVTTTSNGSSSGGGGSGGGGSGGAGLPVYDASTGETETIDSPTVDTDGTTPDSTSTPVFTDISSSWAQSYIQTLASLGIVNGNGEGAFEPNRNVTRVEFLKMTLLAFGHTYDSTDAGSVTFSDVDMASWTANVVGKGQELGFVNGYGAGKFRPNDTVTREEAIKMLINSAGITVDASLTTSSYADVSGWSTKYIEKAKSLGIIATATNFRPTENITRAESAKVIVKAIETVSQ